MLRCSPTETACSCIALLWMLSVAKPKSQDSASDNRIEAITTTTMCRKTMRERIDLNRGTLFFLGDQVAHAANGVDVNLCAAFRKLLAEAVNIDLDRI